MTEPTDIDLAAYALDAAKEAEAQARAHRIACEEAVIALVGLKDEGSNTTKTDYYRVTTTQTIDRKLSEDYGTRLEGLPVEVFHRLVNLKPSLDVRAFKALEKEHPDYYRLAQSAVVSRASKPAVKVELLAQEEQAA